MKKLYWNLDGREYRIGNVCAFIENKGYFCQYWWMTSKWLKRNRIQGGWLALGPEISTLLFSLRSGHPDFIFLLIVRTKWRGRARNKGDKQQISSPLLINNALCKRIYQNMIDSMTLSTDTDGTTETENTS